MTNEMKLLMALIDYLELDVVAEQDIAAEQQRACENPLGIDLNNPWGKALEPIITYTLVKKDTK